ncbi:MAG TPA: hypothetical protein VI408_07900 [Gaiellaceae bacterium]
MLALAVVAAYTATAGGRLAVVGASLAGAGAFVLLAGVALRIPLLVPWAVILAGGGYLAGREHHSVADGWAPVVGAALLLAAELASWSIEHEARIHETRTLVVRQATILVALVAGAAVVSFVLVGTAAISLSAGVLVSAVGVAAAVASIGVVVRLLRT